MMNAAIGGLVVFCLVKGWPWITKRFNTWIDERIDSRIKEKKDE